MRRAERRSNENFSLLGLQSERLFRGGRLLIKRVLCSFKTWATLQQPPVWGALGLEMAPPAQIWAALARSGLCGTAIHITRLPVTAGFVNSGDEHPYWRFLIKERVLPVSCPG